MKKKPIVFFTIVDDNYFYPAGTHILINSFKKFHPDIPLVVYRQDMVDMIMKPGKINFYNAKPTFAKLLTDEYEMVVNIDCDTIITARLDEIINSKCDVGGVWNYNMYENAEFAKITAEMYIQAGLVGSRDPKFWDIWEEANKDWEKYIRKENDVLNLVWYGDPYVKKLKREIWDKDQHYMGCKSLGQEGAMYVSEDKLMLNGEQVKAYHWARGGQLPKMIWNELPFTPAVRNYLNRIAMYGNSITVNGT